MRREELPPTTAPARPRSRLPLVAGVAAVALAGLFAAMTDVSIAGHWHGLFLLRGKGPATLELKDDLFLGDGSRLVAGVSFGRVQRLLSGQASSTEGAPRLELEWDERQGNGLVRNRLAD